MPRIPPHVVPLPNGTRVRFSLFLRPNEVFYFVRFKSRDGRDLQRTTMKGKQQDAIEAAHDIITTEYQQGNLLEPTTWDDALELMDTAMQAQNLRPGTIYDYKIQVSNLRKIFPGLLGPGDMTVNLAQQYKLKRSRTLAPDSLKGNLNKLSCVWSKWFIRECKVVGVNPWEEIEPPKCDEPKPRYISPEEEAAFYSWLLQRWHGWRLPVLFFTVKGITGRRILQLCSVKTADLTDGLIVFESESAKGRKTDYGVVSPELYQELLAVAGPTYLWEKWSEQLPGNVLQREGKRYGTAHIARCKGFEPRRLKRWLQQQVTDYNDANQGTVGFVPFTAHNFRDTALTRAWNAGIAPDQASVAYGVNSETMKKHYIRKDTKKLARDVFARIYRPEPVPQPPTAG